MAKRTRSHLAWVGLGFIACVIVTAMSVSVAAGEGVALFPIWMLAFPVVGALIVSRGPGNAIGWIMLAVGVVSAVDEALLAYIKYTLIVAPGSLPRPDLALAMSAPMWVPLIGLMGTFVILLFPDGRLPSPGWRLWAWFCAIALTLSFVGIMIAPANFADVGYPSIRNALAIQVLQPFRGALLGIVFLIPVGIVGCAVALIKRFRRSRGQERLQLKWLAAGAGATATLYLSAMVPTFVTDSPWDATGPVWLTSLQTVAWVSFALIPVAVGIAILKHRLYDIDVVINKTLVFGALAAFITVVYVSVVVGVGQLIGAGEEFDIGLSIFATAVVAIAFQPFRERVQRLANRLVYGERATPYEILSNFTERVANSYAADEVLPRLARHLGEATGAERARVWLAVGDFLVPSASWPEGEDDGFESLSLQAGALPQMEGVDRCTAVEHKGELLGALSVTKSAGDPVRPVEEELLDHLASQAGLVLRNVRLTTELQARLDEISRKANEIRGSRQRIVRRQDDERRRLERNLHDGAQQYLVAIAVKLRLAMTLASRDPERARAMLTGLRSEMSDALEALRDLARGVYPALLSEQGLTAALAAQAQRSEIPVAIHAVGVARYPIETEVTVYFCCLEAMQNIGKYSKATEAVVEIEDIDRELAFTITDNGVGFDAQATQFGSGLGNIADRLEAVGGNLEVTSKPGMGTRVEGRIPLRTQQMVGA